MRQIIITEGQAPELRGEWKVGELLKAVEFLQQWILSQQINKQNARQASTSTDIVEEQ